MLEHLTTESRNEKTMHLDQMKALNFLEVMNEEDMKVAICGQTGAAIDCTSCGHDCRRP